MAIKHLFLPKLVPGASISEPAHDALWDNKDRQIIQAMSDGIEVDETAQTRGVSSIPDIYARPLTFLGAFTSEKHPLRKRVVQEWRGLLSLLALHKVNPDFGNLSVTPVELNNDSFGTALKNLAPRGVKLQKNGPAYNWTDFLLIKFDNIPIGAFSPATLVYTSADYNKEFRKIRFSLKDDDGFLKPPGKTEGLDLVGEWLEWFIKEFNKYALTERDNTGDNRYSREINKQLDSWLSEIKQEFGYSASNLIDIETVKMAEEPIELAAHAPFINSYAIYKSVLTPLVKSNKGNADGNKSEYALQFVRNNTAYKEIVVIDEKQLAQDRILWHPIRPAGIEKNISQLINTVFNAPSGTIINRIDLSKDDAIWIRPELYFLSDTLLRARSGHILNSKEKFLNAGNTQYVLPFRKEILRFFSPVDIEEKLQPRYTESEGKVTFTFKLPLKGGRHVEVKKVYRLKNSITNTGEGQIVETDIPVLEIFPNYLGDFWCQYFMLCSDTDALVMEPLHFEKNITVVRKEQKNETNEYRDRAEIVKISGYNAFPEGILLRAKEAGEQPFGVVLLGKNPDIETKPFNGDCLVGIDLGTSNTNIFKYSNGHASKWNFAFSRYLRSVLNADEPKRTKFTQLFFVPAEDQGLPIPTTLRVFKAGVTENMLLDHFLFFPNDSRYPDNVYSNIKWDDDTNKLNSYLKSLIFLLMVDLIQERVGNIEFRCSYPKSFTSERIRIYKLGWTDTLQAFIHEAKGSDEEVKPGEFIYVDSKKMNKEGHSQHIYTVNTNENGKFTINIEPTFVTEGISAGEYFSSEYIIPDIVSRANKTDGSICIDVGGGTCDYSIWYDNKITLDASVKLSGKDIARLLKNNARVRNLLFSAGAVDALNEVLDKDQLFSSRLNYVLRSEEKEISANLIANANNKDIPWLRRMLAIKFGALAFYAAHLCIALDDYLGKSFSKKVKENGVKLHWGGNAAKFINWIDFGRHEKNGIASKFLNSIFSNAIIDKNIGDKAFKPAIVGQVQSPGHKDEASGGIVVMTSAIIGRSGGDPGDVIRVPDEMTDIAVTHHQSDEIIVPDPDEEDATSVKFQDSLVVGEKVVVNGQIIQHYELINKYTFFSGGNSQFSATELTQLDRFVYLVNYIGKALGLFPEDSQITLSPEEKLAIKQRIRNDVAVQAAEKPGERSIEPVFIMEVRYLLDILSHKMK